MNISFSDYVSTGKVDFMKPYSFFCIFYPILMYHILNNMICLVNYYVMFTLDYIDIAEIQLYLFVEGIFRQSNKLFGHNFKENPILFFHEDNYMFQPNENIYMFCKSMIIQHGQFMTVKIYWYDILDNYCSQLNIY